MLGLYYNFMNIKRYDKMPFYIYPSAKSWISFEDTFLTFLDWAVDAHELERNTADKNRSFYDRKHYYLYDNFLRYNNETIANAMFDTQLRANDYARLNSAVSIGNTRYFAATAALHTFSFMYLAYFFRFRRVGLLPTFGISCAYYYAFTKVNNLAYKLLVDKLVIQTARDIGQEGII